VCVYVCMCVYLILDRYMYVRMRVCI
jgi:hypothetical protein